MGIVMDFLTGRSQMKNVACEMNLKDDFIGPVVAGSLMNILPEE